MLLARPVHDEPAQPEAAYLLVQVDEVAAIFAALPKADPRLRLLIELAAELRAGQAVRAKRSDTKTGPLPVLGERPRPATPRRSVPAACADAALEERRQPLHREIRAVAVVQVHVRSAVDDDQFLRAGCPGV